MPKILISGDNSDLISNISKILKENINAVIIMADDTLQAANMAITESPDLIIINAKMADPAESAVCIRLRENPQIKYIPLLVIEQADSDEESKRRAVQVGADDCLIRPNEDELIAHVISLLRIRNNYDELRLTASQMQETEREKFAFLPEISHELRSPLNSILGFVELIISEHYGPINNSQHQYLSIIDKSGRRLLGLVDDISFLAKLETGKIQKNFSPFSLRNLVEDIWMNLQEKAENKSIDFECSISPEIDQINGDRRLLFILLDNLLDNSIKFNHFGGKITLSCQYEQQIQAGNRLKIRVSDTGKGITPEDRPKLFIPFPRIKKHNGEQGTGLGLVICKKIATLLKGEIKLESEPGVGTTVEISLPL